MPDAARRRVDRGAVGRLATVLEAPFDLERIARPVALDRGAIPFARQVGVHRADGARRLPLTRRPGEEGRAVEVVRVGPAVQREHHQRVPAVEVEGVPVEDLHPGWDVVVRVHRHLAVVVDPDAVARLGRAVQDRQPVEAVLRRRGVGKQNLQCLVNAEDVRDPLQRVASDLSMTCLLPEKKSRTWRAAEERARFVAGELPFIGDAKEGAQGGIREAVGLRR